MPRKRRPTPPLPGSIVRVLAPKPSSSESIEQSDRDDSSTPAPVPGPVDSRPSTTREPEVESFTCMVPGCRILRCTLPTHLNYGRQQKLLGTDPQPGNQPLVSPVLATMSKLKLQFGLPENAQLPIVDTPDRDFRRLFNQFFNDDFDHFLFATRPQSTDKLYKEAAYRLAQSNQIYCLTVVAMAHIKNVCKAQRTSGRHSDHLTELLYTTLLQITRQQLESFGNDDIDVLLCAIVVLCQYDLSLNRYDTIRSHRLGMRALVEKCGGVHNLTMSMPCVLQMDRFLAVRSNELPLFMPSDLPSSCTMRKHNSVVPGPGRAFYTDGLDLAPEVISLCEDLVTCLNLMDEIGLVSDPPRWSEREHPKTAYYLYLQENIEVRHCILNHRYSRSRDQSNKNLLAITAVRIMLFYVCSANYTPFVSETHSTRLWNMLTCPGQEEISPTLSDGIGNEARRKSTIPMSDWENDAPFLLWLLFVCALPYANNDQRSFAARLRQSPNARRPDLSRTPVRSHSPATMSQQAQAIVSPSSPRRQRYLPSFILQVAEHVIGERPVLGTTEWDAQIMLRLHSFIWAPHRLSTEFQGIVSRVHEDVLIRAGREE